MHTHRTRSLAGILLGAGLMAAGACAGRTQQPENRPVQPAEDLWTDARLESAYLFNRHLNNFNIQTQVHDGAVLLTGKVGSEIDKDLAEEIALSLDGVRSVDNQLFVTDSLDQPGAEVAAHGGKELVDDATTTARVKTRLSANEKLSGLKIDVDTKNAVVTLSGNVDSDAERQLAGLIARNTPKVESVDNALRVSSG